MNFLLLVLAIISVTSAVSKRPQFSSYGLFLEIFLAQNFCGIIDVRGMSWAVVLENSSNLQFRGMTQAVLLENRPKQSEIWMSFPATRSSS